MVSTNVMGNLSNFSGADVQALCAGFGIGALVDVHPLASGAAHANFRLVTDQGRYFVRHDARCEAADLRFEAAVLGLLSEARFPAPSMLTATDGRPFVEVAGGKACLFTLMSGEQLVPADVQPDHLLELGRLTGRMHKLLLALPIERPNPVGRDAVARWLPALITDRDPAVTRAAAELQRAFPAPPPGLLPKGVIHGDLRTDEVKWLEGKVSGLVGFGLAGVDVLALELAVAINAWCFRDGEYQWGLAGALIDGYHGERPLQPLELDSLLPLLRFGAVRFSASQLRRKKDVESYLARVRALDRLSSADLRKKIR